MQQRLISLQTKYSQKEGLEATITCKEVSQVIHLMAGQQGQTGSPKNCKNPF